MSSVYLFNVCILIFIINQFPNINCYISEMEAEFMKSREMIRELLLNRNTTVDSTNIYDEDCILINNSYNDAIQNVIRKQSNYCCLTKERNKDNKTVLKCFPSIIIAGFQKAGTTALAAALATLQNIDFPPCKELHFFDNNINYKTISSERSAYLKLFPTWINPYNLKEQWNVDYSTSKSKLIPPLYSEATPFYISSEKSCSRMAHVLPPTTKYVLLLRHPLKRAYSEWLMKKRRVEQQESFKYLAWTGVSSYDDSQRDSHGHHDLNDISDCFSLQCLGNHLYCREYCFELNSRNDNQEDDENNNTNVLPYGQSYHEHWMTWHENMYNCFRDYMFSGYMFNVHNSNNNNSSSNNDDEVNHNHHLGIRNRTSCLPPLIRKHPFWGKFASAMRKYIFMSTAHVNSSIESNYSNADIDVSSSMYDLNNIYSSRDLLLQNCFTDVGVDTTTATVTATATTTTTTTTTTTPTTTPTTTTIKERKDHIDDGDDVDDNHMNSDFLRNLANAYMDIDVDESQASLTGGVYELDSYSIQNAHINYSKKKNEMEVQRDDNSKRVLKLVSAFNASKCLNFLSSANSKDTAVKMSLGAEETIPFEIAVGNEIRHLKECIRHKNSNVIDNINSVDDDSSNNDSIRMQRPQHYSLASWDKAIQQCVQVKKGIGGQYIYRSLYAAQIARCNRNLPRSQMLLVVSEDLQYKTQKTFNNILDFIYNDSCGRGKGINKNSTYNISDNNHYCGYSPEIYSQALRVLSPNSVKKRENSAPTFHVEHEERLDLDDEDPLRSAVRLHFPQFEDSTGWKSKSSHSLSSASSSASSSSASSSSSMSTSISERTLQLLIDFLREPTRIVVNELLKQHVSFWKDLVD